MKQGKLLIISGPSAGVGKDTILNMFVAKHPNWQRPPSTTTRLRRMGEVDGLDYNFISRADFQKLIEDGQLLEWFDVTGNLYGTLLQPVEQLLSQGHNVILRKDPVGALAIKKVLPKAIAVFLVPDDPEALSERLRKRATDSQQRIEERLKLAKHELGFKDQFDYVVVNPDGHPEQSLLQIEKILGL